MKKKRSAVSLVTILFLLFTTIAVQAEQNAEEETSQELFQAAETFTGDFDQMVERRFIRVLMPYSKTFFFFDGAKARGASYEGIKEFEKYLNTKLKTGALQFHALVIPTARQDLLALLKKGEGDLAVANLTITEDRLEDVDFSDPIATGVDEILVSAKNAPDFSSLFDLAGKKIYTRKSSSYYQSLLKLNETLRSVKKKEVTIVEIDDHLEDEDLLEMVNSGVIPLIVVDNFKAKFWAEIFDNIKLHSDIKLRSGGKIAWAMRKNSPKLKKVVNEFIKGHKEGTLFGNIILKRYLKDTSYITNSLINEHLQRFKLTVRFFEKYGKEYNIDHLMLAAIAYQESKLDQNLRSQAGAVGVMQILPSTAKDKNVNIPDITELDPNIHAGTKYIRFMADRYFSDDSDMDILNRTLFAFASYNAGPAKIEKMRSEAKKMGLDPNVWFNNVEVAAAKYIGRETVQYVSNILKYYVTYKLLEDKMTAEGPVHLSGENKKKKKK